MRGTALLVAASLLGGCGGEPPQLFSAYCEDGTRVVATRERAENLCFRRQGLRQIAPFEPSEESPPPQQ